MRYSRTVWAVGTLAVIIGAFAAADAVLGPTPEQRAARERQFEVERTAKAAAEAKAKEEADAACARDLECIVKKVRVDASVGCRAPVERSAKHDFEWIDGALTRKFPITRWANREAGIVTFAGDEIKFQNGLGTWQRHAYECDFDISKLAVVDVRVRRGRL